MNDNFKNIRICNRYVQEIKSDIIKSDILKLLDSNIYLKKKKVILEDDIKILKEKNHPVMIEYNSYRILILLTIYNNRKYCILIDQNIPNKIKMILIKQRFSDNLYNNTLFDCELLLNKRNNWNILIFDIIMLENKIVTESFDKKYEIINNIIENNYVNDKFIQLCNIKKKKVYMFNDLVNLINNNLYNSDYLVSGIIFVTDENYLLLNFNNKVYQNNNQKVEININKSNRNFEMRITNLPDIFELYDENNKIGIASISTLELSELCNSVFKKTNNNKTFFECKYNSQFEKWEPVKYINI
jgi:hypothetical protein